MINHEKKFVFVHIPKTAGTSVAKHLNPDDKNRAWDDTNKIWKQHATMKQINQLYHDDHDLSAYFKFAFVRNPWDRAVSDWMFLKGEQNIQTQFQCYLEQSGPWEKIKNKTQADYRYDHIIPQRDYIYHHDRLIVDYVGRFENLQHDMDTICDRVGLKLKKLPHALKTNREHYSVYYNDHTRQLVQERYAQDIECFGYKFEE